jgi:hypothetical protein
MKMKNPEKTILAEINAKSLKEALNHVLYAVAKDDSRANLQSVHLEIQGDYVTFIAADYFTIVSHRVECSTNSESEEPCSLDIPVEVVTQVLEPLLKSADKNGSYGFAKDDALGQILTREGVFTFELPSNSFPEYQDHLPKGDDPITVRHNRKVLMQQIKDNGTELFEIVYEDIDGYKIMHFHTKNLTKALQKIGGDEVVFEFYPPFAGTIIRPIHRNEVSDDTFTVFTSTQK